MGAKERFLLTDRNPDQNHAVVLGRDRNLAVVRVLDLDLGVAPVVPGPEAALDLEVILEVYLGAGLGRKASPDLEANPGLEANRGREAVPEANLDLEVSQDLGVSRLLGRGHVAGPEKVDQSRLGVLKGGLEHHHQLKVAMGVIRLGFFSINMTSTKLFNTLVKYTYLN